MGSPGMTLRHVENHTQSTFPHLDSTLTAKFTYLREPGAPLITYSELFGDPRASSTQVTVTASAYSVGQPDVSTRAQPRRAVDGGVRLAGGMLSDDAEDPPRNVEGDGYRYSSAHTDDTRSVVTGSEATLPPIYQEYQR